MAKSTLAEKFGTLGYALENACDSVLMDAVRFSMGLSMLSTGEHGANGKKRGRPRKNPLPVEVDGGEDVPPFTVKKERREGVMGFLFTLSNGVEVWGDDFVKLRNMVTGEREIDEDAEIEASFVE